MSTTNGKGSAKTALPGMARPYDDPFGISSQDHPAGTPAFIYGAKSSSDKNWSIARQLRDAGQLIAAKHWDHLDTYHDEGFSAYSGNRGPQLIEVIERAKRLHRDTGKTVMLVGQAADRFARGAGDQPQAARSLIELWIELRRHGVWLRTVQDDFELRDEVSVANLGRRAYLFSKRLGDSVRSGLEGRREKKLHRGGGIPYGYEPVLDSQGKPIASKPLVHVPAHYETIRQIIDWLLAGMTDGEIIRTLGRRAVPAPGGDIWHASMIFRIRRNPFYRGLVENGQRELVRGLHEPMYSEAEYLAIEAKTKARTRRGKGGRAPIDPVLFTNGHLRCACGMAMSPRTRSSRGHHGKAQYVCRSQFGQTAVPSCGMPPIFSEVLDGVVLAFMGEHSVEIEATVERMLASQEAARAVIQSELVTARAELKRAASGLSTMFARAAELVADGASAETIEGATAAARQRHTAAETKVQTLEARERRLAAQITDADAQKAAARAWVQAREALLATLNGDGNIDERRARLRAMFPQFQLVINEDTVDLVADVDEHELGFDLGDAPRPSERSTFKMKIPAGFPGAREDTRYIGRSRGKDGAWFVRIPHGRSYVRGRQVLPSEPATYPTLDEARAGRDRILAAIEAGAKAEPRTTPKEDRYLRLGWVNSDGSERWWVVIYREGKPRRGNQLLVSEPPSYASKEAAREGRDRVLAALADGSAREATRFTVDAPRFDLTTPPRITRDKSPAGYRLRVHINGNQFAGATVLPSEPTSYPTPDEALAGRARIYEALGFDPPADWGRTGRPRKH